MNSLAGMAELVDAQDFGMAELVDAQDLKSCAEQSACRFDPGSRQQAS